MRCGMLDDLPTTLPPSTAKTYVFPIHPSSIIIFFIIVTIILILILIFFIITIIFIIIS